MLWLFLLALGGLAALTAYTRNFQRTVVALAERADEEALGIVTPRWQWARTGLVVTLWPLAFLFGLAFIGWWKVVALVVGAFLLLVPLAGSFTPRPMAPHYLAMIRRHLLRHAGSSRPTAQTARAVLVKLDHPHEP